MEPDSARERAGAVGADLASYLTAKIIETIAGFPASSGEQRSAIARLICEGLEEYADDLGRLNRST